jgi:hypothetical protein
MKSKPPINSCFACNRKFRGSHSTAVQTHNGIVHVHAQCVEEMRSDGMLVEEQAMSVRSSSNERPMPECRCSIGEPRHLPSCDAYDPRVIEYLNSCSRRPQQ